jgi:two-component system, sensor histidine kinase and response regulator
LPFEPGKAPDARRSAELPLLPRKSTTSLRVLVAEDNPVNQMVLENQLAHLGYDVVTVGNGREVLERLEIGDFDLLLMDCQMPVLDGYETARRVRQNEVGSRHLPIIALTAHAMKGDREKCLAAGMDDYLSKPFTEKDLDLAIRRWVLR